MMRAPALAAALLLWVGLHQNGFTRENPALEAMEACDAAVTARPKDVASYMCYARYAKERHDPAPALARLERMRWELRDDPRVLVALSQVVALRDPRRAIELATRAVQALEREGDRRGEIDARVRRAEQLTIMFRLDEGQAESERAERAASDLGLFDRIVGARLQTARVAAIRGDMARVWILLRPLELDPGFEGLSINARANILQFLCAAAADLGLHSTRNSYARRLFEIAERNDLAGRRLSLLIDEAGYATDLKRRGFRIPEKALAMAHEALQLARTRSDRYSEVESLRALAKLTEGEEALTYLDEIERARSRTTSECVASRDALTLEKAKKIAPEDASRAAEMIRSVEKRLAAVETNDLSISDVSDLSDVAAILRRSGPRETAIAASLAAVHAAEVLADRQDSEDIGMQLFAAQSEEAYNVVDYLLDPPDAPATDQEITRAFNVMERVRGRALRLQLAREGLKESAAQTGADQRLRTLDRISALQRRLLEPGLSDSERGRLETDLERVEIEDLALRARARSQKAGDTLVRPLPPATLAEVRGSLDAEEAVIVFVVPPGEGIHGWLTVLTSKEIRKWALPPASEFEPMIRLWLGLVEARDETERYGAARLYKDLLSAAVESLPSSVTRLVIIPDGPVFRLPLDALRRAPDEPALAERFDIAVVPSATVWLELKKSEGPALLPLTGIVLADPEVPPPERLPSEWRVGSRRGAPEQGLPNAIREADAIARTVGNSMMLRVGPAASEAFLRSVDLAPFSILHFATHAIVDAEKPDRSAVLLAPGSDLEDGLLQAREVRDMHLQGKLVTLSACRSADGTFLTGEGLVGLAHSFFRAGARTVVGSLWPLRDDEAAAFMEAFYEHLGRGDTAAHSVAEAKRDLIRKGASSAACFGIVLMGAGESRFTRPCHALPRSGTWVVTWAATLGAVAVAIALRALRRLGRAMNA